MIEDSGVGAVSDSVQAEFENYVIHRQLGSGPRSLEFLSNFATWFTPQNCGQSAYER